MITKNTKKMIDTCLGYADDIQMKPYSNYPANSKISLRNILKDELLTFLGFLFDPDSSDIEQQIVYLNSHLDIIITQQNFIRFINDRCKEEYFLKQVPQSLMYFVSDDVSPMSSRTGYGISISRYLINCFNEVGCQFIAYGGISTREAERLSQYIGMMQNYIQSFNVNGTPVASFTERVDKISYGGPTVPPPQPETAAWNGTGVRDRTGQPVQLKQKKSLDDLMEELNSLIGLDSVKGSLSSLINLIKVRKMREQLGFKSPDMSMHLVFSGNPGTGKTTVARLLAEIYHQLGVVSRGQLVEVDRAGLVEGYVGQTAIKTAEVIDSAMGGVLFIDEAYTLTSQKESEDFGQEAVDTLLKRMEDNRADFVVIVAGYTENMKTFINSNPGLKSRFNKFIEFPDYTGEEMFRIYKEMCFSHDFVMDNEAEAEVKGHLENLSLHHGENFANAREVRNYFERCVERQAGRIVKEPMIDANSLTTFKLADVKE